MTTMRTLIEASKQGGPAVRVARSEDVRVVADKLAAMLKDVRALEKMIQKGVDSTTRATQRPYEELVTRVAEDKWAIVDAWERAMGRPA